MAGELVDGVADAGVHGLPEHAVATVPEPQHVRVRAAGVETDRRVETRLVAADFQVGDHVVDADEWHVQSLGDRAGRRPDDSQAGAESRPAGEGDGVDGGTVALVHLPCDGERSLDDFGDLLAHVFGGLAGVDAAALGLVGLRFDDRLVGRGVVDGGAGSPGGPLDAENPCVVGRHCLPSGRSASGMRTSVYGGVTLD